MKVVLNEDVDNLGYRGDIVNVAAGFARNFLLPQKLALEANPANLKMIEQKRHAWAAQAERDARQAEQLKARLEGVQLRVVKKAGETETLYGSVTPAEIASLLGQRGIEIDRRKIQLREPIKSLGTFEVPIKLHREVVARVRLEVLPETPVRETAEGPSEEPTPAAAEPADEAEAE